MTKIKEISECRVNFVLGLESVRKSQADTSELGFPFLSLTWTQKQCQFNVFTATEERLKTTNHPSPGSPVTARLTLQSRAESLRLTTCQLHFASQDEKSQIYGHHLGFRIHSESKSPVNLSTICQERWYSAGWDVPVTCVWRSYWLHTELCPLLWLGDV